MSWVRSSRAFRVRRTTGIALASLLFAAAWIVGLAPGADAAPVGPYFGPNVRVDRPPAYTATTPSLAIGSTGVVHIAFAGSGGSTTLSDIFLATSTDGGIAWTTPVRVNGDAGAANQADPSLFIGGPDHLYVVWTDNRNGNDDIFFARSTDGGLTFTANVRVNDVATSFQRDADVVVDPANPSLVHVVWTDNRNQFSTGPDIYYANSTDGGLSFNPSVRLNTDAAGAEQSQPTIAVTPDSTVHAAWSDPRTGARGRDILFSQSSDRGATWTPEIVVNDDTGNAAQTEPTLAADPAGILYLAWTDGRNPNTATDIFATRSTNGGSSFAGNVQVNDDAWPGAQNQASLALVPGRVQVAWTDWRASGTTWSDVYTASSADGLSWDANLNVNLEAPGAFQSQPSIGLDAFGSVIAAWSDSRAAGQDVYAAVLDPIAPTADAGSAQTVDLGAAVVFDGSASTDNRGVVGWEWDFDDGLTGTGMTPRHTYAAPGTYNITLTVWDGSGNVATSIVQVTVLERSPTAGDLLGQIRILQTIAGALAIALVVLAWIVLAMRKREREGRSRDAHVPPPPAEMDAFDLPPPPSRP